MNNKQSTKTSSRVRWILRLVGVVAFITLIFFQRGLLIQTYNTIKNVNITYLLVIPLLQVVNYSAIALYYKFAVTPKMNLRFKDSWSIAAALGFVNVVLPSGGISGVSFLILNLRDHVNSAIIAVIQLGRYIASMFSYVTLAVVAAVLFLTGFGVEEDTFGAIRSIEVSAIELILISLFGLFLASLSAIFKSKKRASRLVLKITKSINKSIKRLSPKSKKRISESAAGRSVNELYESLNYFLSYKKDSARAYAAMLLSTTCEVAIVTMSLMAVGVELGPLQVLTAMTVANLVGVVSVIPGDVGVHEASAVATLALFGVDEASALSAVLIYRFYVKAIFVPLGYWFYNKGIDRLNV